jgi:hypothetical protein
MHPLARWRQHPRRSAWFPNCGSPTGCATLRQRTPRPSTVVAAYEDLPGHHLLVVRNLIASTNDESYHGSASELPRATLHLAWVRGVGLLQRARPSDVLAVPRRRRLLVRCSNDSSTGSYDPARECFMVAIGDVVDGASSAGAGDREPPRDPWASAPRNPGPSTPPPRRRVAPT